MNLIKINLLPYREMEEQKKKKQFRTIMVIGAAAGLVAAGLIYSSLAGMILNQQGRNESLQAGIATLDKELEEIKTLNEQKRNFLERRQRIAELDNKRFEGARIIDTLNQLVPDGAYLLSLKGDASKNLVSNKYAITGKAISDNKVAVLMTALPSTGIFEQPELVKIEKTDDGQQFILNALLLEQKVIVPDVVGGGASVSSGAAAASVTSTPATSASGGK
ncbi:PilN domain-containing protein [Kingella kingae]|uniref:Type IV pilus assembly protein PilN n=2 Tax=Kingella kingae TaxID=504 RepID=F5S5N3_KINKI|nr:PilN domain-containing protein [Kingella kingae]EGK11004.1 type IV pilus assembly protein PilN [Kingella kingae ATCC 23330]MDK4533842.1 PilN domain-containing protein [Kingella kingae]MDK4540790.1 PilN domain-containing protein [Kingella kingae]MDK4552874.1 PilN domain-containing protein [Kingella kingae]UOP03727.1 PilN domain-containing protein [Kingella kingae]